MVKPTAQELYAQLYDVSVPDWPGEVDFYRQRAAQARSKDADVLEVACGTGRIALRLAQEGARVTGLDISPELLAVAREKSAGIPNVRWVEGDMRTFELGQKFGLVIIPGHSFQFMLTPGDQVRCLETIQRHLVEDGVLVVHLDHQDVRWLGGQLVPEQDPLTAGAELVHPVTGQRIRRSHCWAFEPSTQTATVRMRWEGLDEHGNVAERWTSDPVSLHCVFRFEMEHLLRRAGFAIAAVYGDFFNGELGNDSREMIWVAKMGTGIP